MTWLLWSRFVLLSLLVAIVSSLVWLHASQERQR